MILIIALALYIVFWALSSKTLIREMQAETRLDKDTITVLIAVSALWPIVWTAIAIAELSDIIRGLKHRGRHGNDCSRY